MNKINQAIPITEDLFDEKDLPTTPEEYNSYLESENKRLTEDNNRLIYKLDLLTKQQEVNQAKLIVYERLFKQIDNTLNIMYSFNNSLDSLTEYKDLEAKKGN